RPLAGSRGGEQELRAAPALTAQPFMQKGGAMNKVLSHAAVAAGLVFMLGGAASWGQVPPTNDKSDSKDNTGGGTGALGSSGLTGQSNTAYGFNALTANTTGSVN